MSTEVTSGYKVTEVGVIPKDWEVVTLGDVIDYTKGFPFRSVDYTTGGVRIIRVSDTTHDSISESAPIFISPITSEAYSKWSLNEFDIIVSTVGSKPPMYDSMVGKAILVEKKFAGALLNQNAVIIRNKKNEKSIQVLVASHLRTKRYFSFVEGIFRGNANQASITLKDLFEFVVPMPVNHDERQAIAAALSDMDALINGLDQLIAKKRDIKQATMQQLLTGQQRLPGFNGEWKVKRLGDVASFLKGKGLPKSELTPYGADPCIHYGELFTLYPETIEKVISRTNGSLDAFRSIANDVLMPTSDVTPRGLAKASCVTIGGVILGGDILVIRSDSKQINGSFLSYVIRHHEDQVLQLVTGSTVFHLYGSDMKKFTFSLPPAPEQTAIANILSDMESELTTLESRRQKTCQLKQGMVQELLTGRTRLL